ncbi:MAG TPA: PQQ-binding-like beta-propeller repeat protein [Polyangiales bacterium]|nr:PQQ-binding-like beta-propeller repeat protein [Polyangiales bacterium]
MSSGPQLAGCVSGQASCGATAMLPATSPAAGSGSSQPGAGNASTPSGTQAQAAAAGSTAGAAASGIAPGMTATLPAAGAPAAGSGDNPATAQTPGGTWRMMGFDETNTYHNPYETILSVANAPMLKEKWRFTVAGFPPGSPVVAEGKVFVMATGGTYAISLADGSKVWERTDIAGTASLAYENGFIYAHDVAAEMYKLNAADGKTLWGPVRTNEVTECDGTSSPIVGNGIVATGHACGPLEMDGYDHSKARGGVEAFDIETGMRKWVYYTVPATGENGAMVWSSPAIDIKNMMVFAATGNNYSMQGENSDSIHAIDIATGMRQWKTQIRDTDTWSLRLAPTGPDYDFGANPILGEIAGKPIVADGDKGGVFHVFDRVTGQVLWERDKLSTSADATHGGMLMNGGYDGKYFYLVANQPPGKAVLHALDPMKQGADAWPAMMLPKITWGAPAVANGVLAVPSDDDLLILNAMTGEMLAKFATGGTIGGGSPALVDGHVIVASGLSYYLDTSAKNNNQVICYAVPDAMVRQPVTAPAGGTMTSGPTFVPGSATWSAVFQEVIVNNGCNGGSTCHASTSGGNLVMQTKADSYKALVNMAAMGASSTPTCAASNMKRVVPSDPDNSLLINKLEQATPACGARMPPGAALKPEQIKQVRDWVAAGAKDD